MAPNRWIERGILLVPDNRQAESASGACMPVRHVRGVGTDEPFLQVLALYALHFRQSAPSERHAPSGILPNVRAKRITVNTCYSVPTLHGKAAERRP